MESSRSARPLRNPGTQVLWALALGLCACAGGESADGPPTFNSQVPPFATGNDGSQQGPAAAGGDSNGATDPSNTSQSGQTGGGLSGNTPEGSSSGDPLDNGSTNGSEGAMAPGAGGAGSMMPSSTPSEGTPTAPVVGAPPVTTPDPTTADTACPAGAIFCSGFEGTGLPAGTRFEPDYLAAGALGTEIRLDTAVSHSGSQSLHMPVGSNYYRMLSVAVPSSFWVRLYTRSNVGFGAAGSTHASLFMGSIVEPGGDYNADRAVEIAEQFGQVLLNVKDSLYGTSGTNPNGMPGTRLPDNTWTCMEAEFDGPSGDVRVFVEGDQIIDAAGWQPPTDYKSFRFGYLRFDSPARDVWMDDVVIASDRVGCQ